MRRRGQNAQIELDAMKLAIAVKVVSRFTPEEIRKKSLQNLANWKAISSWVPAYDEWSAILNSGNDELLIKTMTGADENSNRLRQSMPYVGLLRKST